MEFPGKIRFNCLKGKIPKIQEKLGGTINFRKAYF
jgi:hypothetical protein